MTSGRVYRIDEMTGTQVHCDALGRQIKPVNYKATGRFNYDGRRAAQTRMAKEYSSVERPIALKSSLARVYGPRQ